MYSLLGQYGGVLGRPIARFNARVMAREEHVGYTG